MKRKTMCQFCKRKIGHKDSCYIKGFEAGLKIGKEKIKIIEPIREGKWLDLTNKWSL